MRIRALEIALTSGADPTPKLKEQIMSLQSEPARDIFLQAVELPQHDWEPFLAEECGKDHDLKRRVTDLLAAHQGSDSFFDQQPATTPLLITEAPGDSIGGYKLLQQIGEGGFGVVFMAEQTKPIRRKVALKVIKPGMDTKEVVARFEAERQALAVMDHPNIARVFDAGATEAGRPYFVMELVKGVPLTQYADANHLSTSQRLDLFALICRAVHHAHQKGIIHRDLKPSNVLVTLHDGRPVPKIIDFGVAKAINQPLTEKTMFTQFGQAIGTPQYMSPEQAEMSGLDIDTRSDVYSLGVILYELLTGQTPFTVEQIRAAGLDEMRRVIREQEPARPSNILATFDAATATAVASHRSSKPDALQKSIRGELDWIVLKALEKDRHRRYDSASNFAEDIDRHLQHEPVTASPPTMRYQCWKFYQRYESACKVALATGTLLIAAITTTTVLWIKAEQHRRQVVTAMKQLDEQRQAAQQAADSERDAKASAQATLGVLIEMLSKAKVNPETGKEPTVSEALSSLASDRPLQRPAVGGEQPNIGNFAPDVSADLHRELGKAYLRAGRAERAIAHLQNALVQSDEVFGRQSVQSAECLRLLGEAQDSNENLREAIGIYESLDERRDSLLTRIELGRRLMVGGDLTAARTTLDRACRDFDQLNPRVEIRDLPHLLLSRVFQGLDMKSEEDAYFDSAMRIAVSQHGGNALEWIRRANSFYDQERYWESEFASRVSLKLGNQLARYRLGYSYYQNGDIQRAIETMRDGYGIVTERGRVNEAHEHAGALARFHREQGDLTNAIKSLADAVRWAIGIRGSEATEAMSRLLALAESSPQAKQMVLEFAEDISTIEPEHDHVAANVASCLGLMRLTGYPIGSAEANVDIAFDEHYKNLAKEGHFDTALDFGKRSFAYFAGRDNEFMVSWERMRCARLLYQCLDFNSAIEFQEKAVEGSLLVDGSKRGKRDNRNQILWAKFELAHILRFAGETEKAESLAKETLAEVQQLNAEGGSISHKALDTFCKWQLRVIADGESGARVVLEEAANYNTDVFEEYAFWKDLALGMAHEELGNHDEAIDAYETAAMRKYRWPSYPRYHFDDRLLELLVQTNQLERAEYIFENVLKIRREDLVDRHPLIGLTRLRLADVLLRRGDDADRAIEILDKARETMQMHEITPQHVIERIDRLAQQAKSLRTLSQGS